jgi:hypothetical protein
MDHMPLLVPRIYCGRRAEETIEGALGRGYTLITMNRNRRPRASLAVASLLALAFSSGAGAQALDPGAAAGLPAGLDAVSANAWQPSLLTAFGTFTYADSGLPSPFSRYLEDGLMSAIPKTSRIRLFNRSVAAAMDPAFREVYGDFFKKNSVDALLSGRYYLEGANVRTRLELTGLSDGVLIGTFDFRLPCSTIPPDLAVDPSAAAAATASSIDGLAADSGKGGLKVSVSTERGAGAVYREGEKMVVLVTANKAAYIKVFHVDALGVVRLILPNKFSPGLKRVAAGSIVRVPAEGDSFSFDMTPPFGTEFIKVVASTRPFAADESAQAGEGAFADLGTDVRGAMTRGIKVSAAGADGPAERAEAKASYVIVGK